jgi:hypothetical protein
MAKKVVATLKTAGSGKAFTKCIKMTRSDKTGAYTFKSEVVPNEEIKDFWNDKK